MINVSKESSEMLNVTIENMDESLLAKIETIADRKNLSPEQFVSLCLEAASHDDLASFIDLFSTRSVASHA